MGELLVGGGGEPEGVRHLTGAACDQNAFRSFYIIVRGPTSWMRATASHVERRKVAHSPTLRGSGRLS